MQPSVVSAALLSPQVLQSSTNCTHACCLAGWHLHIAPKQQPTCSFNVTPENALTYAGEPLQSRLRRKRTRKSAFLLFGCIRWATSRLSTCMVLALGRRRAPQQDLILRIASRWSSAAATSSVDIRQLRLGAMHEAGRALR